ncbi:citrate lyase holo-[acyl-carrier protein] synthase [Siculibacillus lacustris]|uniref:citrate lyase holo-[acyl-carrier protein] synthase n=1 Tax=Siculibacillus lacustris TaxID=1549641 RepID=A0A4Q9VKW7_9HYPH|nr:citrate lyase holo-[acyl-carrier protein] synthase [Siculibacillus lacustris]TBW36095.1 citrate lyase holo-[acyl-carrier protein] synthase [Siculibacillus lacustris]
MTDAPRDRRAGPVPPLAAVLAARERRVARRDAALAAGAATVVVVTPVMPGPVKLCGIASDAQSAALAALAHLFAEAGWAHATVGTESAATGFEAIFAVAAEPLAVKRATVALEDGHPLGRLWDIDVTGPDGATLSRRDLGAAPRRCLVCDAPGHACARSQAHPLDQLLTVMEERLDAAHADDPDPRT